jgi:hypothetical protein
MKKKKEGKEKKQTTNTFQRFKNKVGCGEISKNKTKKLVGKKKN